MTVSLAKPSDHITIDKDRALDLLRQAVEVKGSQHVQTACYYVTGEPSWDDDDSNLTDVQYGCMVGTALAIAKPSVMGIFASNSNLNEDSFDNIVDSLPEVLGITVTEAAASVFLTAQYAQDGRGMYEGPNRTWGEALDLAREVG